MPKQRDELENAANLPNSPTSTPCKGRFWRRFFLTLLLTPIVLPLLFYGCIRILHPNAGPQNIRVSKETTHFTGPLDGEGNVDYLAAVNGTVSEGVTRENNAAVLFWQSGAVERVDNAEFLGAVSRTLGVEPYAAREDVYVNLYNFVIQRPELVPQRDVDTGEFAEASLQELMPAIDAELEPHLKAEDWPAVHGVLLHHRDQLLHDYGDPSWPAHQFGQRYPWKKETYPEAAAWLAHIDPVMETLTAMMKRPRYYSPIAGSGEPPYLPAAMLPDINSMVEVSRAFSLRAMLHMGEGDVEAAWADVMAIHRLARLAAQQPWLVSLLVAYTIEGKAIDLEECIFASEKLSRAQLEKMLDDIRAIKRFPSPAKSFDEMERCLSLECVQAAARHGGAANVLSGDSVYDAYEPTSFWGVDWWINQIVDWNNVLVEGNAYFDTAVPALEQPTYQERKTDCEFLEAKIQRLVADAHTRGNFAASYVQGSAMERRLSAAYIATLMPAYKSIMVAEERNRMRQVLAETALLIAMYRADHQQLPQSLDALVPDYCDAIPTDRFDGQPIRYRPRNVGYVLYSVDVDEQDEGGMRPGAWQLRNVLFNRYDVVFEAPPLVQPE